MNEEISYTNYNLMTFLNMYKNYLKTQMIECLPIKPIERWYAEDMKNEMSTRRFRFLRRYFNNVKKEEVTSVDKKTSKSKDKRIDWEAIRNM